MAKAIQRAVERRTGASPKLQAFPWWLIKLAAPHGLPHDALSRLLGGRINRRPPEAAQATDMAPG